MVKSRSVYKNYKNKQEKFHNRCNLYYLFADSNYLKTTKGFFGGLNSQLESTYKYMCETIKTEEMSEKKVYSHIYNETYERE